MLSTDGVWKEVAVLIDLPCRRICRAYLGPDDCVIGGDTMLTKFIYSRDPLHD